MICRDIATFPPHYSLNRYEERWEGVGQLPPLKGSPVLFLPGSAGSGQQVRSLASVAAKAAATNAGTGEASRKLDFFFLDFAEEFSALSGKLLRSQAEFAAVCIGLILEMYREQGRSIESVVLVGHSMGGVVARSVFIAEGFVPGSVKSILTLASPLR